MNLGRLALIGHNGFVGSNLAAQLLKLNLEVSGFSSTTDPHQLYSSTWDSLIIAAPSAVKWFANLNPLEDARSIESLLGKVQATRSKKQFLFSTVDVYAKKNQNENDSAEFEESQAYGRNRRKLEETLMASCSNLTIIRLPALFGIGLKKNIFYDLLNKNQLENVSIDSIFQWYPVSRLLEDLRVIADNDIKLINLVSEPIETSVVVNEVFPELMEVLSSNSGSKNKVVYECESIHSYLWRESGSKYLFPEDYIINLMKESKNYHNQSSR
jgi:hypothetical protein